MHYGETRQEADASGPGRSYMEQGISFYRLFVTRSNLSVDELIVYTPGPASEDFNSREHIVHDFDRALVRRPRRGISKRDVIDKDEEDFIVPNGLSVAQGPKLKTVSQEPTWVQRRRRAPCQNSVDYRLIYDALIHSENSMEGSESVDITTVTNQLRQVLADDSELSLPLGTL